MYYIESHYSYRFILGLFFQVYYIHDGSEFSTDSIFFEIELSTQGARTSLPVEMQVKQRFQLQISIRPQNDVPKIGMYYLIFASEYLY